MATLDLKENVLNYIKNKADAKFLRLVNALANSYAEEEITQRDTIEQYTKEIDEAILEVKNGEFYTQEEVEKMAEKW